MSVKIILDKNILHKYFVEEKYSEQKILSLFGISKSTLYKNLKEYGFKRRSYELRTNLDEILTKDFLFEQFITLNKSGLQISKEFNIPKTDVYRALLKQNIIKKDSNRNLQLANRTYNVDMLEQDTPFFWYFLGFFFGDGTVVNNPKTRAYSLRVSFGIKTLPVIEEFKKILGGSISICKRHRGTKVFTQYDYIISSKYLVDLFIQKYNIQPNKTDDLHFPLFMNFDYFNYFLRGYLDSDGCVHINRKQFQFFIEYCSNSNKFLETIQSEVFKRLNIDSNLKPTHHKCNALIFGGKKRIGFGEYLYKDVLEGKPQAPYLDYKYQKFLEFYK